ncbi:hypothetical protein A9404_03995 [Halothiobacillus diazotrophicus]|uniref:Uncharacterized protein n=2 Tax=Halothiobacillus diazotrophicus TaxID=1860122 RepID=A0A191ZFL6_9GAMM|nr:hypothetical protein A9404_03995 [Halothiobacillus diazotrophicus]
MSLWMLSIQEQRWLAAARSFYENPEFFIDYFYKHVATNRRTNSFLVFPGRNPAYHQDYACPKLRANYLNYRIPVEIIARGPKAMDDFRAWFRDNIDLLQSDPHQFVVRMSIRFRLRNASPTEELSASNSGITVEQNPRISEIKKAIDTKIREMLDFRRENIAIVCAYGNCTHKVKDGAVHIDDEGARRIVDQWHNLKEQLKTDLKTYFMVRFNPDLEFGDELLQKIGFKACNCCASSAN